MRVRLPPWTRIANAAKGATLTLEQMLKMVCKNFQDHNESFDDLIEAIKYCWMKVLHEN